MEGYELAYLVWLIEYIYQNWNKKYQNKEEQAKYTNTLNAFENVTFINNNNNFFKN